jgi:signal peptidase
VLRSLSLVSLALATAVAILVVAAAVLPLVTPVHTQIVTSGSMAPHIPVGALIVTVPVDGAVAVGEVILFPHPWRRATVVHRVVALERGAVESHYVTKGDGNDADDGWRIAVSSVKGRVVATVPYVGYLFGVARMPIVRLGTGVLALLLLLPTLLAARPSRRFGAPHGPPHVPAYLAGRRTATRERSH